MPFDSNTDDEPEALLLPGRRNFLKTLGVAGAAGLAGCSTNNSDDNGGGQDTDVSGTSPDTVEGSQREVGGEYIVGDSTDAETMNWIAVADVPTDNRIGLALDSAYAVTTDNEVFPLWADISTDDKRVYEVELREGLEWGAGYGQMTAEDWVYMIENVFQAEDNWAGYANQSDWQRGGEFVPVEKTGKRTFEIQLPDVDPAFPLKPVMWGQYCMPKGLLEKYVPNKDLEGLQQDEEVQQLAYSGNLGAYNFEEWEREAKFTATRNDDYYMHDADDVPESWQNAPFFDRFTYKVIPEESTRLSAMETGEITQTGIPSNKVDQLEGTDGMYINVVPQAFNSLLIYNQRANGWGPFREQSVRQALANAVNKQAVVENILRGYANVAHTFQPQFSEWYDDSQVVETGVGDSYDHDQVRSDLESALSGTDYGYDGDQVVGPDGDQVTLKLVYPTGTQTTETTCEFIAQEYGGIGIDVELEGVQFNTLLSKYAQNSYDGSGEPEWNAGPFNAGPRDEATSEEAWDMQYGIIFNTYPRTPSSTRVFWEKKQSTNYFGYYPETDFGSLYDQASQATDESERQELYAEIFGSLSEEQPCNFMNMGVDILGYDEQVRGPVEEFGNGWNQNTWYFDQE